MIDGVQWIWANGIKDDSSVRNGKFLVLFICCSLNVMWNNDTRLFNIEQNSNCSNRLALMKTINENLGGMIRANRITRAHRITYIRIKRYCLNPFGPIDISRTKLVSWIPQIVNFSFHTTLLTFRISNAWTAHSVSQYYVLHTFDACVSN